MSILKSLNQRPIAYYPIYRQITGSTTAGILLSQLMYWFSKQDTFHKTDADIMSETLLTENELRSAKNKIKNLEFVTVFVKGIPAKTYYQIDWDMYETSLVKFTEPNELNSQDLDCEIHETIIVKSLTKTTAEITTENIKTNKKISAYQDFITQLKSLAPIKSKVTATKDGEKFFKAIQNKEQLINDYIAYQNAKGEFAIRITPFMEDYNSAQIFLANNTQKLMHTAGTWANERGAIC